MRVLVLLAVVVVFGAQVWVGAGYGAPTGYDLTALLGAALGALYLARSGRQGLTVGHHEVVLRGIWGEYVVETARVAALLFTDKPRRLVVAATDGGYAALGALRVGPPFPGDNTARVVALERLREWAAGREIFVGDSELDWTDGPGRASAAVRHRAQAFVTRDYTWIGAIVAVWAALVAV